MFEHETYRHTVTAFETYFPHRKNRNYGEVEVFIADNTEYWISNCRQLTIEIFNPWFWRAINNPSPRETSALRNVRATDLFGLLWTFRFHKRRGISRASERLLRPTVEEIWSVVLFIVALSHKGFPFDWTLTLRPVTRHFSFVSRCFIWKCIYFNHPCAWFCLTLFI
jgi:hypothetical protein